MPETINVPLFLNLATSVMLIVAITILILAHRKIRRAFKESNEVLQQSTNRVDEVVEQAELSIRGHINRMGRCQSYDIPCPYALSENAPVPCVGSQQNCDAWRAQCQTFGPQHERGG